MSTPQRVERTGLDQRARFFRYHSFGEKPAPPQGRWWPKYALLAACLLAFVLAFDWNWFKRLLEAYVTGRTQRSFTVSDLDVDFGWTPILRLRDVVFANARWADARPMARIALVEFSISLTDLFRGKLVIPNAVVSDGDLRFERLADDRKNWIISDPDDTSLGAVRVGSLSMSHCTLEYIDHRLSLVVAALASDVDGPSKYTTRYRFEGKYRDALFSGNVLTGSAAGFQDSAATVPIRGHFVAGTTALDLEGSLTDIAREGIADLHLRISGQTLANLYPFLRLPLPASPPYRIEGQLSHRGSRFDLRDIRGLIGSTDVSGTAAYLDRQPRPLLQIKLQSDLLDVTDLGPMVGVKTKSAASVAPPTQAETSTREAAQTQELQATGDRILPAGRFEGGRLRAIDADAELSATRIAAPDQLAAGNVHATVQLRGGVIKLAPFNLELAGGRVAASIELDAHQPILAAQVSIGFQQLHLGQLLPRSSMIVQSQGLLDGKLALRGTGNSVADVAANANGHINAVLSGAQISNLIDAAAGLNGGKVLQVLAGGDKDIPVRCGAAAFDVREGQGHSTVFVVDTEQTRIDGGGSIDFDQERFDLLVAPLPKHASILSLRTPVRLHGTFRHADYELDKKQLALRAGSAIALGLIAPAAAFLPFIETGPGKDVDCAQLSEAVLASSVLPPK